MRSLLLVAMLIPLLFVVGCGKPVAKKPAQSNDEVAAVKPEPKPQPQPPAPKDKKKDKDEEPNWLKPPPKPEPGEPQGASGKIPWGLVPPEGGWQNPNPGIKPMPEPQPVPQPQPNPQPNPMGMGKLDPQPQPVPPVKPPAKPPVVEPMDLPAVTEADMKEVWLFIENISLASGKMPPAVLTFKGLIEAKAAAAPLVNAGSIYLTGTAERESIWAFDFRAFSKGEAVLVATQNGVETITAEQLKARLGLK